MLSKRAVSQVVHLSGISRIMPRTILREMVPDTPIRRHETSSTGIPSIHKIEFPYKVVLFYNSVQNGLGNSNQLWWTMLPSGTLRPPSLSKASARTSAS